MNTATATTSNEHPRGSGQTQETRPLRRGTRKESWAGWVRRDTSGGPDATSRTKEKAMILKASSRARMILASSVELYREMAVSALSLVKR